MTQRRFVDWAINWREDDYEVVRYENGRVILVAECPTREEAFTALHFDRAVVLADPMATQTGPVEHRVR